MICLSLRCVRAFFVQLLQIDRETEEQRNKKTEKLFVSKFLSFYVFKSQEQGLTSRIVTYFKALTFLANLDLARLAVFFFVMFF